MNDSGATPPCFAAKKRPREASEHGADGKSAELCGDGVDAKRAAGDFVLAQSLPGAPNGQAPQPQRDEIGEQRQHKDDVIKENGPVDRIEFEPEKTIEVRVREPFEWQAEK